MARSVALGAALYLPVQAAAGQVRALTGSVFVNRSRADRDTVIRPGDRVTAAHGAQLIFTLDDDAFLVRGGSSLQLERRSGLLVSGLRLLTGGLLAVFGRGDREIVTSRATIGIRGTAVYLKDSPERTYFCTCYGNTEIHSGQHRVPVSATHHQAHYIDGSGADANVTGVDQVIDHSDDELRALEALVGRVPRFDR